METGREKKTGGSGSRNVIEAAGEAEERQAAAGETKEGMEQKKQNQDAKRKIGGDSRKGDTGRAKHRDRKVKGGKKQRLIRSRRNGDWGREGSRKPLSLPHSSCSPPPFPLNKKGVSDTCWSHCLHVAPSLLDLE